MYVASRSPRRRAEARPRSTCSTARSGSPSSSATVPSQICARAAVHSPSAPPASADGSARSNTRSPRRALRRRVRSGRRRQRRWRPRRSPPRGPRRPATWTRASMSSIANDIVAAASVGPGRTSRGQRRATSAASVSRRPGRGGRAATSTARAPSRTGPPSLHVAGGEHALDGRRAGSGARRRSGPAHRPGPRRGSGVPLTSARHRKYAAWARSARPLAGIDQPGACVLRDRLQQPVPRATAGTSRS